MDRIEMTGKTVDDAVAEALKALNVARDEADVEIIDVGAKGFIGIGAKDARVVVTKKYNPCGIAKDFIRQMCLAMGIIVTVEAQITENVMSVNISGENVGVLIGKRGQTLDSIQYLLNLVVNKGSHPYLNVVLDTENYRQRRKETLETLALNLAKKVKLTKRSVRLEPMSPYERRIIHSVLQGDKAVSTHSEGDEPFRNVVINFKR